MATGSKNQRPVLRNVRPKRTGKARSTGPAKRQSATRRLPRRLPARAKYSRRVRRLYLPLLLTRLEITLRNFRTPQSRRSKRYKQLVIPFYTATTKQIAIRPVKRRPAAKPSRARAKPRGLTIRIGARRWSVQKLATGLLLLAGVAGAIFFAAQIKPTSLGLTGNRLPTRAIVVSPAKPNKPTLSRSLPTHLTIDKVEIDTDLLTVGKNPDETIEVPADYHKAGWYEYSPTPGELGPSIIVGHVDNVSGVAVFWRLRELSPGDIIKISRADGQTHTFRIDSVEQVPQTNFPTDKVYGNIDHAGLRLITCGGTFNNQTQHYDQNTVVYASLVK